MTYMLPNASSMTHLPPWYGFITSDRQSGGPAMREGRTWCIDCGVFTGNFDPARYRRTLEKHAAAYASTCRFAVAPDVIADAVATLERWPAWRDEIRGFGLPAALVGQDGMTVADLPHDLDALFIGGTDAWRDGGDADAIITEAKRRGTWVHVGRVNSIRRIRRYLLMGVDSVDGTFSVFAGMNPTVSRFDRALSLIPLWRSP